MVMGSKATRRGGTLTLQLGQARETIKALEAPKAEEVAQGGREEPLSWWRTWLQTLE
jgi:hypothetical protein